MWLDNLRTMKDHSGMTTKEISKQSGIPEPTLEKLFAGATKDPKLPTMQKLVHFLGYTLDDLDDISPSSKKTSLYSSEAAKLADAYDNKLDRWGRQAVRELVETEVERCLDEAQLRESPLKEEPKVIPLYTNPAAAGYAAPIFGEDFEPYELKPEDPQGAMFAVRVSGDSMEPHFPDGSIAFCNKDPIADGEIGVFCLDGDSFIKQYHYDPFMGMTYLFSLNRRRSDADKLVTRSSGQTLTCMGRVMTRKRYPVPGRG